VNGVQLILSVGTSNYVTRSHEYLTRGSSRTGDDFAGSSVITMCNSVSCALPDSVFISIWTAAHHGAASHAIVHSNPICVIGCVEQIERLDTPLHMKHTERRRSKSGLYIQRLIEFEGVTAVGRFIDLLSSFFRYICFYFLALE
jgi:hypothetical protein